MQDKFDFELEQELSALRRREKVYFGVFSVIVGLSLFIGWQSFQEQRNNYVSYEQYYAQQVAANGAPSGGGCGTGGGAGGCCGGSGSSSGPVDTAQITTDGLAYYVAQTGDKQVEAEVTDYGCHIQCDIVKDGEIIKSYTYRDGQFIEM